MIIIMVIVVVTVNYLDVYAYKYIIISSSTPISLRTLRGFRGLDSSIILVLRGGILRPIWDFPESLSQAMLAGIMLVGGLGVVVVVVAAAAVVVVVVVVTVQASPVSARNSLRNKLECSVFTNIHQFKHKLNIHRKHEKETDRRKRLVRKQ